MRILNKNEYTINNLNLELKKESKDYAEFIRLLKEAGINPSIKFNFNTISPLHAIQFSEAFKKDTIEKLIAFYLKPKSVQEMSWLNEKEKLDFVKRTGDIEFVKRAMEDIKHPYLLQDPKNKAKYIEEWVYTSTNNKAVLKILDEIDKIIAAARNLKLNEREIWLLFIEYGFDINGNVINPDKLYQKAGISIYDKDAYRNVKLSKFKLHKPLVETKFIPEVRGTDYYSPEKIKERTGIDYSRKAHYKRVNEGATEVF